jgi:prolipoprotein diacylglyceryltransferase
VTLPFSFPLILHLGPLSLHAHTLFELLAYTTATQIYRLARKRTPGPSLSIDHTLILLTAAICGAWLGSKLLAIAESPDAYLPHLLEPRILWEGKTIAGGILGAWLAVELAKLPLRLPYRTGDAFVPALTAGIAIGRIGCFLEGLPDHTFGLPSNLPWAIDFGDHIPRHPTQLYESLFALTAWTLILTLVKPSPHARRFRYFILAYFTFRLCIEFLKPRDHTYAGLSAIQWASLLAIMLALTQLLGSDFRTNVGAASAARSRAEAGG